MKHSVTSLSRAASFSFLALLLGACAEAPDNGRTAVSENALPPIAGELESARAVMVAPPSISRMWQYSIKQLVPENTHVKEGEVVVAFDDKPVRERLIDKKAELEQARSELGNIVLKEEQIAEDDKLAVEEKRAEYEKAQRRAQILDHSMSRNERQKAAIDFEVATNDLQLARELAELHKRTRALNVSLAEGKVEQLEAETAALQAEVNKLRVVAPIAGLVQYLPNWQGEKPSEGESVRFGQPVLQISDLSQMQVRGQADEVDKARLFVGAEVDVTIDSAEARTLSGRIIELGSVVRDRARGDRRRVIDLLVGLDPESEADLKPGMTASIVLAPSGAEKAIAATSGEVR
ncbi:putative efflux pump membrane fusion protein [Microbulbifer aggregans]|uniref:Putative efflux pump membrane fusion protein n=1 Tax=Microbulbifer aggregans TaxID=1769779 RepID=A0A1C9W3F9_9GAMM|nr:HlyD family efflux transporter periplasmic adaptor subunit [Microbulbifer aggregans]AOS95686.1 putative efflux pump membrane fusion protein [Microbulbifer aggregans]